MGPIQVRQQPAAVMAVIDRHVHLLDSLGVFRGESSGGGSTQRIYFSSQVVPAGSGYGGRA
jgi:hypothetical protein